LLLSGFLLPVLGLGQQLPIRTYTLADGLAEDRVNRIVADSRGYVWIATAGGLSRFDGYLMKTHGVEDGLPYRYINALLNALLEMPSGAYLVGALHGLFETTNGTSFRKLALDETVGTHMVARTRHPAAHAPHTPLVNFSHRIFTPVSSSTHLSSLSSLHVSFPCSNATCVHMRLCTI
jgi:hypothetical protein